MIEYTVEVHPSGTKKWFNEKGQFHREDGAAIEYVHGGKEWYKEGKLHRLDGPAIEWANGDKSWYKEGLRHREDGPAVEWTNATKSWYLNDVEVTEDEVMNETKELTIAQLEELLGHKVKVIK